MKLLEYSDFHKHPLFAEILSIHPDGFFLSLSHGLGKTFVGISSDQRSISYVNTDGHICIFMGIYGKEAAYSKYLDEKINFCSSYNLIPIFCHLDDSVTETELDNLGLKKFPFGYIQKLKPLSDLNLAGQRMRRLRYLVSKFQKENPEIVEYKFLDNFDKELVEHIISLISQWTVLKGYVPGHIAQFMESIKNNTLPNYTRVFVTYSRNRTKLENVILITEDIQNNGYLLDFEFYGKDSQLGHLEYTINEIIELLKIEGKENFSLGLTLGIHEHAKERDIGPHLHKLRRKGIFAIDGNYQFKQKFQPINSPVFLITKNDAPMSNLVRVARLLSDPIKPFQIIRSTQNKEVYLQGPAIPPIINNHSLLNLMR